MATDNVLVERDAKPYMLVDGGADFDKPIHRFYYYPVKGRLTDANRYLLGQPIHCYNGRYTLKVGDVWQPLELLDGKGTKWEYCDETAIVPPGRGGKDWQWVWYNMGWCKRYKYNENR